MNKIYNTKSEMKYIKLHKISIIHIHATILKSTTTEQTKDCSYLIIEKTQFAIEESMHMKIKRAVYTKWQERKVTTRWVPQTSETHHPFLISKEIKNSNDYKSK